MNLEKLNSLENEFKSFELPLNFPQDIDVTISGGGFSVYYTSLFLIYLHNYSKIKIHRISGVSAGAAVAAFMLGGVSVKGSIDGYNYVKSLYYNDKDITPVGTIRKWLENLLPDNIAEICNNRLFINVNEVTLTGLKPTVISTYSDKEDVINAVVASSSIPLITISSLYTSWKGKKWIDGFQPFEFTDNQRPQLCVSLPNADYDVKYVFRPADLKIHKIMLKGWNDFKDFCFIIEYVVQLNGDNIIHNYILIQKIYLSTT
jgi:hypothetical protein